MKTIVINDKAYKVANDLYEVLKTKATDDEVEQLLRAIRKTQKPIMHIDNIFTP